MDQVMVQLIEMVSSYGYIALFGLLAIGIVGLPVPDETLMVLTGYFVSIGTFSYTTSLVVCFAGSMTGMIVSYSIGRHLGKPVMHRYGRWIHLTPKRLAIADLWFHKYGVWTVAFGYFVPGLRHFTCYLAGVSGIRLWRYLLFAGSGALIWCTTFITLGYYVGENWETILEAVHRYVGVSVIAVIAVAVLIVVIVIRVRRKPL